jgi:hypothetical protein
MFYLISTKIGTLLDKPDGTVLDKPEADLREFFHWSDHHVHDASLSVSVCDSTVQTVGEDCLLTSNSER